MLTVSIIKLISLPASALLVTPQIFLLKKSRLKTNMREKDGKIPLDLCSTDAIP